MIHHTDMTINIFWLYIEHAHPRFQLCYCRRVISSLVGHWVFLQSVASTLKCFSLQHICPKWSLIAHWRMHDIKCLQTWNNHVLSLLEIVCSGICIYHQVEQNWSSHHTSEACPIFIWSCQLYKCERIYLFYWYICLCYCLLHENSCFPCAVEMHRTRS